MTFSLGVLPCLSAPAAVGQMGQMSQMGRLAGDLMYAANQAGKNAFSKMPKQMQGSTSLHRQGTTFETFGKASAHPG